MNPFDRAELEEPPPPSIEDVEQMVRNLVNGRGADGHPYSREDLDRVRYTRAGSFTLREELGRQAESLTEEWGLHLRPVREADWCPVCHQPGCFRHDDEDARALGGGA